MCDKEGSTRQDHQSYGTLGLKLVLCEERHVTVRRRELLAEYFRRCSIYETFRGESNNRLVYLNDKSSNIFQYKLTARSNIRTIVHEYYPPCPIYLRIFRQRSKLHGSTGVYHRIGGRQSRF